MAVMSARITGGGGSLIDSGVADVFAKALFGDPEREMTLAKGRSALATDEYTRRLLEEKAAYEQARTTFQTGQNAAIEGATTAGGQLVLDNLRRGLQPAADARVAAEEAATTQDLGGRLLPVPMDVPNEALPSVADADLFQKRGFSHRYDEPVPVDTSMLIRGPAGPAVAPGVRPTGSALSPQELLPAGVSREPVPVELPENLNTQAEAEALIGPGLYTNDPMGQLGKGTGLAGIVHGGTDRESQERNALLYAGKTPAEAGAASGKAEMDLRKEYFNQEPVKRFDITKSRYAELVDASNNPNHGVGDTVMIYAMIKMLDPTSSVMGGEQVTAENAPGLVPAQLQFFQNLLKGTGDKFDESGRAAFIKSAQDILRTRSQDVKTLNDYYSRIAAENGIKPENVILTLDEGAIPQPDKPLVPLPNGKMPTEKSDGNWDFGDMTSDEIDQWLALNGLG